MATESLRTPVSPASSAARIRRALLSVSDKTGLDDFARDLAALDIQLLSTGGTAKSLSAAGLKVTDVGAYTGFPEIMDGRVKTLHPRVHGGILARRDDPGHLAAMETHGIDSIDLIVVNLYPFAKTVQSGADFAECVENIDIGGPAMIRAAAKNHAFVTIVTDPADYRVVIAVLKDNGGLIPDDLRRTLAAKAFAMTAAYDAMIAQWLAPMSFPPTIAFGGTLAQMLRYGENPHQDAALYRDLSNRPGVATAKQIQGKELSYNNLNDTDAAFELVAEFSEPAVAIIKHANPSGVATGETMLDAYMRALACDPVSAFGGIIALNRTLDADTAQAILKQFCEVIIAPDISPEAAALVQAKQNIRVLITGSLPDISTPRLTVRSLAGGLLVQGVDTGHIHESDLKVVTKRAPSAAEMEDLLFAFHVCKHVKSNAIVYARNRATIGIGAGQMSRVDSCRIAAWKMQNPVGNMVVASDAFFPFADGLLEAVKAGATAVIQPGGSIRDDEVIKAADDSGIAMVLTGMRHFRH